jgi:hypothetical protein
MNTLDDVLRSPETLPQLPEVQWLRTHIQAGDEMKVALEEDTSPLGSSVSGLRVLRRENGIDQPLKVFDWDDDLNAAMIDLGIKAIDVHEEGKRFARVLRTALRKVERRYGDGYMNAVLVDLIDESDLGRAGKIGEVRRLIHSDSPERRGQSYQECHNAIAIEIGGRAKQLRDMLKYNPEELKTVMDWVIAQYLDERFSISSLRRLGWIDENGRTTR